MKRNDADAGRSGAEEAERPWSNLRHWLSPAAFVFAVQTVVILHLVYPDFGVIRSSRVDAWFYWGSGEAFGYLRDHLASTYYFRRWPVNAIYLGLNGLEVSGYWAMKTLATSQAFILALVWFQALSKFVTNKMVLWIFGSLTLISPSTASALGQGDYQGIMLIFFALALLLASLSSETAPLSWLLCGFLFMLGVVAYQGLAVMGAVFLFLAWPGAGSGGKRIFGARLVLLSFGALNAVFLDYAIGVFLGASWENLISYSLSTSGRLVASGDWGISSKDLSDFLLQSSASLVPILLASLFVSLGASRVSRVRDEALVGAAITSFLIALAMSTGGGNYLGSPQTSVALFFFLILVLANTLDPVSGDLGGQKRWHFAIPPVLGLFFFLTKDVTYIPVGVWSLLLLAILLTGILPFVRLGRLRFGIAGVRAGVLLVTTLLVSAPGHAWENWIYSPPSKLVSDSVEFVETVERDINFVTLLAKEHQSRVWLLDNRNWESPSPVISSFYGNWSALSRDSRPSSLDCGQVDWVVSGNNPVLVVFDPNNLETVEGALTTLLSPCTDLILTPFPSQSTEGRSVFTLEATPSGK